MKQVSALKRCVFVVRRSGNSKKRHLSSFFQNPLEVLEKYVVRSKTFSFSANSTEVSHHSLLLKIIECIDHFYFCFPNRIFPAHHTTIRSLLHSEKWSTTKINKEKYLMNLINCMKLLEDAGRFLLQSSSWLVDGKSPVGDIYSVPRWLK